MTIDQHHIDRIVDGFWFVVMVAGLTAFAAIGAFGVGGEFAEELGYTEWWAGPAISALAAAVVIPPLYAVRYRVKMGAGHD